MVKKVVKSSFKKVEVYNFLVGCPFPRRKCFGALRNVQACFQNKNDVIHNNAFCVCYALSI